MEMNAIDVITSHSESRGEVMGEIADMMINGEMCSWCGICFIGEHSYPVVCKSCAEGKSDKELLKVGVQNAINDEI